MLLETGNLDVQRHRSIITWNRNAALDWEDIATGADFLFGTKLLETGAIRQPIKPEEIPRWQVRELDTAVENPIYQRS